MDVLTWIIVGLVAGLLASLVMGGIGYGILGDIIIGILGALFGGWLFARMGWSTPFAGIAASIESGEQRQILTRLWPARPQRLGHGLTPPRERVERYRAVRRGNTRLHDGD